MNTLEFISDKYTIPIGRQYETEIPNMGRDQLADLFCELGFHKGAEIGVERALYSEVLLKANPQLELYCIDPWSIKEYDPHYRDMVDAQDLFSRYFEEAKRRLSVFPHAHIVKKFSMEALSDFEDESLDFVYIDANHEFVHATNDIYYWSKKVKKNGIIAGHDYAYFDLRKFNHVKHVVLAYTRAYGIHPFFVVGSADKSNPDAIRDKFRSWFFVKQ